jgi:hypothetical protein
MADKPIRADRPIREIVKDDRATVEKRGGYRGGEPASRVPPPLHIPTGSVIPAEPATSLQTNNPAQSENNPGSAAQE